VNTFNIFPLFIGIQGETVRTADYPDPADGQDENPSASSLSSELSAVQTT